jgi:hypothetical protein
MQPTFGHPTWIIYGVLLFIAGIGFVRSAISHSRGQITTAERRSLARRLFGGRGSPAGVPSVAAVNKPAPSRFRRSMSQLSGIVGFLLVITGLMAALLGGFYPV